MAYIIQDSTLTGIADAIRAKDGTTDKIKVSDMAAKIRTIKTGGGEDKSEAIITRSITEYSNDNVKKIGDYAFYYCDALTSVDLPSATYIGYEAFSHCDALTSVDLPSATEIKNRAFAYCDALTSVVLPSVTTISSETFFGCDALTSVDLPSATYLGPGALYNCTNLTNLILRENKVCAMANEYVFSGSKIKSGTGYIYVPKSILDSYKTATNWSNYAAQFRALEDYTVDGTTTGELDTTKI